MRLVLALVISSVVACARPAYIIERAAFSQATRPDAPPMLRIAAEREREGAPLKPVQVFAHRLDPSSADVVDAGHVRVSARRMFRVGHLIAGAISLTIGIAVTAYSGPQAAAHCQSSQEYSCLGPSIGLTILTSAGVPHLAAGIIFLGIGLSPARADAGRY